MAIPPPPPGSEQAHLLEYCDLLVQEGRAAKGRVDKRWEQNLQFVRGKQWSGKRPSYYSDLVVNVVGSSIRKKVSLLTDTKPVISVVPVAVVSEGGADLVAVAEMLTKLARAWWDRCGIADALAWMVYNAQIFGCAFANIFYNPALDNGLGDIDFEPWDPRRVLLDPMVVRSARLDDASWIVLEQVKEIGELVYRFGDKAKGVAADSRYSRFSLTQPFGGVDSPAISGERPMVLGDWTDSVTPRVVVQEFWIRDWRRMRDIPTPSQRYVNEMLRSRGEPERGPDDLVFPRGRHVIRAGGVILLDEENPYWDGRWPVEMISWGMEVDHPWGMSEVEDLRQVQMAVNKLGSSLIDNTIASTNPVWVADFNAVQNWNSLTNRPGAVIRKRPGAELRRDPPPPVPGSAFALMGLLMDYVQTLTGLTDAMHGRAPGNVSSAAALECVDLATECLTRRGWVSVHGLRDSDELYTLDPSDGSGCWSRLLGVTIREYTGAVAHVSGAGLDALVTPEHAWYVRDFGSDSGHYWRVQTDNIFNCDYILDAALPIACALRGDDPEDSEVTDAMLTAAAWVLPYVIAVEPASVTLEFPSTASREAFVSAVDWSGALSRFGASVWYDGMQCTIFGGSSQFLSSCLSPDGGSFFTTLGPSMLAKLSRTVSRSLGAAGDGYAVRLPAAIDAIQTIFALAGVPAAVSSDSRVRLLSVSETVPYIVWSTWEGTVWCPRTETGSWVARRNGKVFVTGNSLQIASQTMIRLQARVLEGFLKRVGQKFISRVFQFMSGRRLIHFLGEDSRIVQFEFSRDELFRRLAGRDPRDVWRDFRFMIEPLSSLAITQQQRVIQEANFYNMGLVPGEEVLKAAGKVDAERLREKALEEQMMKMAPSPKPIAQGGGRRPPVGATGMGVGSA